MDANKKIQEKQEAKEPVETEENIELGIKRVRTYAEDLALAKEKAGVKDEGPKKKKGGFFGGKKKEKKPEPIDSSKDLSKVQPGIQVENPNASINQNDAQPSKEFIEKELARSGIVTNSDEEQSDDKPAQKEETSVPNLRTYKYDTAENINKKGTSKISMLAAQEKRRIEKNDFSGTFSNDVATPEKKSLLSLIALSIILVVSGIVGVIFFFNKSQVDDAPAITVSKNVLFTNDVVEKDARGLTGGELRSLIYETADSYKGRADDLIEIELRDRGLFGESKISKDALFRKLESSVPGSLVRSFSDDYVVGIHSGLEESIFYLFKVKDFDAAFAGMLEWEEMLHLNLYGEFEGGEFVDEFLRNKDTRIQRDQFGKVKTIYSFPNSETLIITQNELAFFELFERLTVSNATQN